MTWQDFLTEKERAELAKLKAVRDAGKQAYNALATTLKNRAMQRLINDRERAKKSD